MSQKTPPTYNPPAPTYAMSGQTGVQQGMDLANQYFAPQMGAQAQGIADIGQGQNYYNNFGPSDLGQAIGNQYMQNIWPQESAIISNQFANSGMANSPALASTMGNAYGNMAVNVGEYEQGISNQNATNNLSQLMSVNPNNYYQPITNDILSQSNTNTAMQNQYQQALAQQQYQQAYNQYTQKNALASTIGQISPIGGQIYGGATGTSGSAFGGTASSLGSPGSQMAMYNMMNQYQMQPGSYQAGDNGLSGGSNLGNTGQSYSDSVSSGYGMPSGSSLASSLPNMMAMTGG